MRTSIVGAGSPARSRLRHTATSADPVRLSCARIVHHVPTAAAAVMSSAMIMATHSAVLPRCEGSSRKSW